MKLYVEVGVGCCQPLECRSKFETSSLYQLESSKSGDLKKGGRKRLTFLWQLDLGNSFPMKGRSFPHKDSQVVESLELLAGTI